MTLGKRTDLADVSVRGGAELVCEEALSGGDVGRVEHGARLGAVVGLLEAPLRVPTFNTYISLQSARKFGLYA